MSASGWMAFAASLLVALAVPGPDLVIVVQSATVHGTRRGLTTVAGIVAGLCLHAALSVAGLAILLASMPSVFLALQMAGAAVLLWLGTAMLRSWRTSSHGRMNTGSGSSAFARGFLTNATNPKALLFFAAVLPQFVGPPPGSETRTIMLAAIVVSGSAAWWVGAVLLVRRGGVGRSPRAERLVTLAGGLTLVAIAVILIALALTGSGGPPV